MRLREIITDLKTVAIQGSIDRPISGLIFDSREVTRGCLFFALTGYQADGHNYISQAIEKGAKCIVHELPWEIEPGITFIRVANSREAMALMAGNYFLRPSTKLMTIGITGTNGKTTTARILHAILSQMGPAGLMGTAGHIISGQEQKALRTTPESIEINTNFNELIAGGAIALVLEVSSHAIALHRTSYIDFDTAVFTNLSQDHQDFHRNLQEYFEVKAELFKNLKTAASAVINIDDSHGKLLLHRIKCNQVTYSLEDKNAAVFGEIISSSIDGIRMNIYFKNELIDLRSPLFGRPNAYNILAAVSAALSVNCDFTAIQTAIRDFQGVRGRFELVDCGDFSTIIDYAHTPKAVETAGSVLRDLTGERLLIVIGCGGGRDSLKRPQIAAAAEAFADEVFITSDNPRNEDPEVIIEDMLSGIDNKDKIRTMTSRREAIHAALSLARQGDVVAILGKGHEDYQEIQGIFHHFDDREVVMEWLGDK